MSATATTVTDEPVEDAAEVTYDTVFFTLSNPRRRYVLHHLKRHKDAVAVGELATEVAAWENRTTTELVSNRQRKRAYSALHQTHLPKMNQLGIINYDRERAVVEPSASIDAIDFYLEVVPQNSAPWHEYYLTLGAVSVALFVVTWLQIIPGLSPLLTAGLLAFGVFGTALYHNYTADFWKLGQPETPPSLQYDAVPFARDEDGET
ncbi:MAG: hypothetical protein V5A38_13015 [Halolamina sp.]|uniref:DUF7344 domain-containing protein n=1 Tax=Halolamina sp. TaxID=1940283 RepID=UPI002FC2B3C0